MEEKTPTKAYPQGQNFMGKIFYYSYKFMTLHRYRGQGQVVLELSSSDIQSRSRDCARLDHSSPNTALGLFPIQVVAHYSTFQIFSESRYYKENEGGNRRVFILRGKRTVKGLQRCPSRCPSLATTQSTHQVGPFPCRPAV